MIEDLRKIITDMRAMVVFKYIDTNSKRNVSCKVERSTYYARSNSIIRIIRIGCY